MKKKIIATIAVVSLCTTGAVALAASNISETTISHSHKESEKILKEIYENTPFIKDASTGELLEKPDLDF